MRRFRWCDHISVWPHQFLFKYGIRRNEKLNCLGCKSWSWGKFSMNYRVKILLWSVIYKSDIYVWTSLYTQPVFSNNLIIEISFLPPRLWKKPFWSPIVNYCLSEAWFWTILSNQGPRIINQKIRLYSAQEAIVSLGMKEGYERKDCKTRIKLQKLHSLKKLCKTFNVFPFVAAGQRLQFVDIKLPNYFSLKDHIFNNCFLRPVLKWTLEKYLLLLSPLRWTQKIELNWNLQYSYCKLDFNHTWIRP